MMRQYFEIKERNKDVLLFYRLGDFYEMFYDDALTASRELELTLTGRDCGLDERAPMCGVPYHAVDGYIAKLIEKGYKVGICEQTTLPEKGKGIVEREIVRIVTAGTVTDGAMLADDKNNYLVGIYYDEDEGAGVSWTDITTGEFSHSQIQQPAAAALNDLLLRIAPSEIICNNATVQSLGLSVAKFASVCPFSVYNDVEFEYENALKTLKEQLNGTDSLSVLRQKKLCVSSAGALVSYINSTQKRALRHINAASFDDGERYMFIDATARKTLELTQNMRDGGRKGTLLWLLDKTETHMGKRMLRKWIERPSLSSETINARLDAVFELKTDTMRDILCLSLSKIHDIERLAGKLSYGNILPRECLSLGASLFAATPIREALAAAKSPLLKEIGGRLDVPVEAAELIAAGIDPNAPGVIREGRVIKSGFDAELDGYREVSDGIAEVLAKLEADEKRETGIRGLKIGFNKVFGYYIEIPKSQAELAPYRFIRKQTVAGGERYITEELRELESKILGAQEKALNRENVLYELIKNEAAKHIDKMLKTAKAVAELDCLVSLAAAAVDYGFVRPQIDESVDGIRITEGRHCVVEKLLGGEPFVPNDTFLNRGDDKIMIITGPNMAGKSVYLRQVALITVMAHMGSFVPAKSASIALTDRVFTRVGASDDLAAGRSTFMVEMSEVSDILNNLTPNSLVLLDEIGRGTSTYDGLSIAWSIIEYLSKRASAMTLFSTHYHELTELEGVLAGVKNYKLTLKEAGNTVVFLRKLMRGSANRSFGIEVAGLAGLPKEVLVRAKELLKRLESAGIDGRTKTAAAPPAAQLSFFNPAAVNEVETILRELDLDNVSPRYAHEILTDLKDKVTKNG
jgi:DNA mismatch repair protein MutS